MEKKFSDRIGITKPPATLQVGMMNDGLRNSIWNVLLGTFNAARERSDHWKDAAKSLAFGFFKVPADNLPYQSWECREWVKLRFYKLPWYEVYNLIEFLRPKVYGITGSWVKPQDFEQMVDQILRREMAGYRYISGMIEPISSEAEAAAVEEALATAKRTGLEGVHSHLSPRSSWQETQSAPLNPPRRSYLANLKGVWTPP